MKNIVVVVENIVSNRANLAEEPEMSIRQSLVGRNTEIQIVGFVIKCSREQSVDFS